MLVVGRASEVVFVKELMRSDVKTARPDSSVREVVAKMNRFDIGSIVIVQERRPIGIITERDILRKVVEHCLDPSICKAKEIMTTPIITGEEDLSVEEAARLMATRKIKRIPIVRNKELVGIITATDLIQNNPMLVELLGESSKKNYVRFNA
jgi:CBS domain-containing protein